MKIGRITPNFHERERPINIAIVAGGTGGHIFPAIAVAQALEQKQHQVVWIGAEGGMETRLVPQHHFQLETIHIQNLRGKGFVRHMMMPFRLLRAILQARRILKKHQVDLVLGFGGFVAGPGGLAAKLLGIPLIIHEQNAVAGMTNRYLARFAKFILTGFPSVFEGYPNKIVTGNPVRADLLPLRDLQYQVHHPLHILVIGGSLGAEVFNRVVPEVMQNLPVECWLQTGQKHFDTVKAEHLKVTAFIDDMNAAYTWADLVICRAGALTVAELAIIGKPAIFVPYPHAVDDHQTKNALAADRAGGAVLLSQEDFNVENLKGLLQDLLHDSARLQDMSEKMRALGRVDATDQVVRITGLSF